MSATLVSVPPTKNPWRREPEQPHPKGSRAADVVSNGEWRHLWVEERKLSLRRSAHYLGITKGGKRFSRFTPVSRTTFVWGQAGLRVYQMGAGGRRGERGKRWVRDITASEPNGTYGAGSDALLTPHLLERATFDVSTRPSISPRNSLISGAPGQNRWIWERMAYPILREVPHWNAVVGMSQALRQRNLQDFTRVAFGSRYRKDLVKAIAASPSLNGAWLAHELQTTFPIDWLIPLIPEVREPVDNLRRIKPFMRWLPEYSAKKLLIGLGTDRTVLGRPGPRFDFLVRDTFGSWSRILQEKPDYTLGDYRITNWRDMHDHLAREFDKIGREDRQIEASKVAKKLDGKSLNGLTLVHPKSTHELIDWGKNMHNCIGGYDRLAAAGKSVLFAVMQGDQMIGNMELDPKGSIRQLVGDYNRALPDPLRDTVYEMVGKPVPATYDDDDFPF
jgi:hypothetical protein